MSDRTEAIDRRELWPLTASEKARVLAALTRGGVAVSRGKSTGRGDRAAERVWEQARARVVAEESAAAKKREEKAAKKAARTFW